VLPEHELNDGGNRTGCHAEIGIQSFHGSYSGQKLFRNLCAVHKDHGNIRSCSSCDELMWAFRLQYDNAPNRHTVGNQKFTV
jgi:hypothetical protein